MRPFGKASASRRPLLAAFLSSFVLWIALPALAAGPPPVITSVNPSPLVSVSKNMTYAMTVYGKNFWPSGPNEPSRWVFSMRRQGQPFQTFRLSSGNNTQMSVQFPTVPLMSAPGTLEIMVKLDGVASNVFAVKIVADPPKLSSATPEKITVGWPPDDPHWKVWLVGSRWIPETTIWIDGKNVGACYQNLNSGQEQMTWPVPLRKIGKFAVQLRTEHGSSETRTVEIVPHPTPTPAMAIKKGPETGPAGILLRVPPTPTPGFVRVKVP